MTYALYIISKEKKSSQILLTVEYWKDKLH